MTHPRVPDLDMPQRAPKSLKTPVPSQSVPKKPKFSHEIHGVRGLALTMVVAFHLFGHGRVSGGVDVFLVISAYLMTGSIDRSMRRGTFNLVYRYARTFTRLVPASLLTIVATVLAGLVILPKSAWIGLLEQASAAATFRENIFLATEGMSYGAAGDGASPFQHFWSLSLQGQFFILWPLAALLLFGVLRLFGKSWRSGAFLTLTLVVTVASFLYAIHLVEVDQPVAYYSLFARVWELGLGGLAYFGAKRAARHPRLGGYLGWVGIALILSSGFFINGRDLFPGPWTLWPVLGTVLVLFAANSGGAERSGLTAALSFAPVKHLANLGYVLYLWHWPILVLYLDYKGQTVVGWKGAIGVLVLSLVLAELTNRFVIGPTVRAGNALQAKPRGSAVLALILLLVVALVGGTTYFGAANQQRRQDAEIQALLEGGLVEPGAPAMFDPELADNSPGAPYVPAAEFARADGSAMDAEGCVPGDQSWDFFVCANTPGPDAKEPVGEAKRIVLAGGSHDVHYYEGLRALADTQGWELYTVGRNRCRLSAPDQEHDLIEQCVAWNEQAMDAIIELDPDAVFTLSTVTDAKGVERTYQGQIDAWKQLDDAGIPVIGLRDNPRFPWRVPDCLQTEGDPAACTVPRSSVYSDDFSSLVAGAPSNVIPIDTSVWFCTADSCPPVIGNVLVYRDYGHFTATYSRTLAPVLHASLQENAPFLFE